MLGYKKTQTLKGLPSVLILKMAISEILVHVGTFFVPHEENSL